MASDPRLQGLLLVGAAVTLALIAAAVFVATVVASVVIVAWAVLCKAADEPDHEAPAGSLQARADAMREMEREFDAVDMDFRARPRVHRRPGGGWAA